MRKKQIWSSEQITLVFEREAKRIRSSKRWVYEEEGRE